MGIDEFRENIEKKLIRKVTRFAVFIVITKDQDGTKQCTTLISVTLPEARKNTSVKFVMKVSFIKRAR